MTEQATDAFAATPTKADLIERINRVWVTLEGALAGWGEDALTTPGGDGWSVGSIELDVPRVVPGQRVDARLAGRGLAAGAQFPFALSVSLTRPANGAGLAAQGMVAYVRDKTRVPVQLRLSGPLRVGDGVRIAPLRLSADVRYTVGNTTDVPFAFALNGPLRVQDGKVALAPAGVALRGNGPVPDLDARAAFAWSNEAALHLDGQLTRWPAEWPALPPPIGQSASPLRFVLDYTGPLDFAGTARLRVARDDTRFDGRFRLPEMLAWVDAAEASPLPPLSGTVSTPRVEIAGAVLEGVDVRLDAAP